MKEKLKKFYADYKNDIADGVLLCGIAAFGTVCVYTFAHKAGAREAMKKFDIVSGDVYKSMTAGREETVIVVNLRGADPVVLKSQGTGVITDVAKSVVEG